MAREGSVDAGKPWTLAQPCDLVAFMAHPDDAELTCGGTLALAARGGYRVGVVDFTRGELGSRGTPEERMREATEAARVLGLTSRINLHRPDGGLHDTDELRREVVLVIRAMRPRVVIAPPLEDHHPDHVAVATTLARSMHLAGVAKYAPELPPWRPHALLHTFGTRSTTPQVVVDISEVHDARRRAVLCYASQLHAEGVDGPKTRIAHPEFLDWIEGGLRRCGFLIGARYGEGFTSAVPVTVRDIVAQFESQPWQHPPEPAPPRRG